MKCRLVISKLLKIQFYYFFKLLILSSFLYHRSFSQLNILFLFLVFGCFGCPLSPFPFCPWHLVWYRREYRILWFSPFLTKVIAVLAQLVDTSVEANSILLYHKGREGMYRSRFIIGLQARTVIRPRCFPTLRTHVEKPLRFVVNPPGYLSDIFGFHNRNSGFPIHGAIN